MHNKFIVTITDSSGSKQYSIHKIIKKLILFAILIFLLIGIFTFLYIKYIHSQVNHLRVESNEFKITNNKLIDSNNALSQKIQDNNDKLLSMKKYLTEAEKVVGIGPDINATFIDRVEHVRKAGQNQAIKEQINAIQTALLLNSIPNGKPLNYRRVSSKFGYRTHPVTKRKSFHAGMDLPAKHGTPIYAPASGIVEVAGKKGAYGNFMLLTHAYGFKTAYGHLSKFAVKSGTFVSKGQCIAYVGSTGRSTGAHLHYEIRYLTKWLNPKIFMEWNANNIMSIANNETKVDWKSIFSQTKKVINISTKKILEES